jgi:hypothetical protein
MTLSPIRKSRAIDIRFPPRPIIVPQRVIDHQRSLRRSLRSRARGRRENPSGAGCAAAAASREQIGSHAAHEPVNEGFGVSSSPPPIATRPESGSRARTGCAAAAASREQIVWQRTLCGGKQLVMIDDPLRKNNRLIINKLLRML